ncbi:MAG: hypothetical protein RR981_03190 [Oscillospiraceae bacterium]
MRITDKDLSVEPPKLKKLRQFMELAGVRDENVIDNLTEALSAILSKNKAGYAVSADFVEENLNFDEMNDLLTKYFEWVGQERNSPN